MNKTQIGENAGIVWNILKDNNHWEYEQLKEISGLSDFRAVSSLRAASVP